MYNSVILLHTIFALYAMYGGLRSHLGVKDQGWGGEDWSMGVSMASRCKLVVQGNKHDLHV